MEGLEVPRFSLPTANFRRSLLRLTRSHGGLFVSSTCLDVVPLQQLPSGAHCSAQTLAWLGRASFWDCLKEGVFPVITALLRSHTQFAPLQRVDFRKKYPDADPLAIDLMERMLEFDPRKRIDVNEALKHPWLAQLHDEAAEPSAPGQSLLAIANPSCG